MDPNLQTPIPTQQPVINPAMPAEPQVQPVAPVQPQMSPQKDGSKKMLKLFLLILFLAILGIGGFVAYSYFNTPKAYNAGVYNYPTSVPASPTPTDVLNPTDTTDSSIDSNNQVVNQNLNSLDTDLNNVSESINDKPTNLQ